MSYLTQLKLPLICWLKTWVSSFIQCGVVSPTLTLFEAAILYLVQSNEPWTLCLRKPAFEMPWRNRQINWPFCGILHPLLFPHRSWPSWPFLFSPTVMQQRHRHQHLHQKHPTSHYFHCYFFLSHSSFVKHWGMNFFPSCFLQTPSVKLFIEINIYLLLFFVCKGAEKVALLDVLNCPEYVTSEWPISAMSFWLKNNEYFVYAFGVCQWVLTQFGPTHPSPLRLAKNGDYKHVNSACCANCNKSLLCSEQNWLWKTERIRV